MPRRSLTVRERGCQWRESQSSALSRLHLTPDLVSACDGVALVIEAIIEQFEAKAALFRDLDRLCSPAAILATNSSTIRGSHLAGVIHRPERVLNLHFFNPALVKELVEVVVRPAVTAEVTDAAVAFCRRIGKIPVILRQEIPGFIVKRIFRTLTREALNLYEEGYASAEDIDLAVTKGVPPDGPIANTRYRRYRPVLFGPYG